MFVVMAGAAFLYEADGGLSFKYLSARLSNLLG
jgi:hypothetical protein